MKKRKKIKNETILLLSVYGIAGILLLIAPSFAGMYTTHVISIAMISYLCVLSVYVLLGMCGQNSFAQAGLWGVGAYLAGNMLTKAGAGSLTAFLVAVIGTGVLAFVLGFAFFRLHQYYFTFASIGLMTILNGLFLNWEEFSGGALGMKNIPPFEFFGFTAATEQQKYYVIFIVAAIASIAVIALFHSSLGRSFMAIRDNEMTAESLGINCLLTKSIAFGISGMLCGAAGALYAQLSQYLSYQSFTYNQSTMYLVMIMIGGTSSPVGSVLGTAIITYLQEGFRSLQNYMTLIYGICVIVLMIFQPDGLLGGGRDLYERINRKKKRAAVEAQ